MTFSADKSVSVALGHRRSGVAPEDRGHGDNDAARVALEETVFSYCSVYADPGPGGADQGPAEADLISVAMFVSTAPAGRTTRSFIPTA